MKVYSVNSIHTPWLSHGYEPLSFWATKDGAERERVRLDAMRTPEEIAEPEIWGYGYEVEEWDVNE